MSINPSNASISPKSSTKRDRFITTGEHMRLFIMAMLVLPSTALAGWSLYEIDRKSVV